MPTTAFTTAVSNLPHRAPNELPEDHPLYALYSHPDYTTKARQLNLARVSLTHDDWSFKVLAFRKINQLPVFPTLQPLTSADVEVHTKIISEEYNEFMDALATGDLIETLDGGLDLIYTVLGALTHMGFTPGQIAAGMQEVHAANMTKLDEDGQPIIDENGKVQKGPNYCPPNLLSILNPPASHPTEESFDA